MQVPSLSAAHGAFSPSQSKKTVTFNITARGGSSRNVDKISHGRTKIFALNSDRSNPYLSKKHQRKSSLDATAAEERVQSPQSPPAKDVTLYLSPLLVTFVVPEFVCRPNQSLVILGSGPQLGNWDPTRAIRLSPAGKESGHPYKWMAEVHLDEGWQGALEFKLAILEGPGVIYEPGSNRLLVVSLQSLTPDP